MPGCAGARGSLRAGYPGLVPQPAVDVAWRPQISRFSSWERGAALPGVARPDEVRRCRFTPYRSSQPGSGQPGASQPRRETGQRSRGLPECRHASAGLLVPNAIPCHREGWPGAPCQEGDWYQRCFHLLCVIPRALLAGEGVGRVQLTQGHPRERLANHLLLPLGSLGCSCTRSLSPSFPPGAGRSGCCCGHVAAVPRSGAREALRNLLLLHKGCVDVPGRPLRALCAATQRRPFPLETSPGVAPGPGCLRAWSSDAGTAEGLVTKATCSQLTPEPEGDGSRWQQESLMAKQGMSWDKSGI